MSQKIFIGPITKGLEQYYLPFNIDNDAFPMLFNAYAWRGRVKRKRGTIALARLQKQVQIATSPSSWQLSTFDLVSGAGNLLLQLFASALYAPSTATSFTISGITVATNAVVTLTSVKGLAVGQIIYILNVSGMTQINGTYSVITAINTSMNTVTLSINSSGFSSYTSGGSLYPQTGSITPLSLSLVIGGQTYTDVNANGTLQGSSGGTGTINYATGSFTITSGASDAVIGKFSYYPDLPVMGLRNFITTSTQYPNLLAFDTKYSYQITADSTMFYNTSFYKTTNTANPPNPLSWSGQNYQQFWTTNYQGSLWATNGNPGLHYLNGTYTSGSAGTTITFNFKDPTASNYTTLAIGDQLWFNQWGGGSTINGVVGTVTTVTGAASGNYVVTFGSSQTVSGTGIAQTLTNSVVAPNGLQQDGIRWYDGDPTSNGFPPTTNPPLSTGFGWVNFSPPLTAGTVSIDDEPAKLYYLAGASAILPFKDRLLFFAPYIQAADGTSAVQLIDTVLWSWNGTPYYTLPVPVDQTSDPTAYYVDQTGKGGWLSAGIDQSLVTVSDNEDVLLIGFTQKQTRFVYTGNDLFPFLFYIINSELGSASTFSSITLDRGALSFGLNGLILTSQIGSQRIDLSIPNQVFQLKGPASVFAAQRVSAARDFYHEWVYFTFIPNTSQWSFPTQTLQYNYREDTWSVHYENFTAHGSYRRQTSYTWATIPFATWNTWNETWASSTLSALFPSVIAGNPQGFVIVKGQGSGEAPTGYITAITNNLGLTQITSTDHCVAVNDYLLIQGVIGLLSSSITGISQAAQAVITTTNTFSVGQLVTISGVVGMTQLNGNTYEILAASGSAITINVNSTSFTAYVSGGTVTSAINGLIGQVDSIIDANNFVIDLQAPTFGTVYLGLGTFTRLIQPFIQTKQFPIYWNEGRQLRLGVQKYLMDYTDNAQVSLYIYLSQDPDDPWNAGPIVPSDESLNNSLVYSTILYTCPESQNIGLTAANTNLQTPTASNQYQIWHRINTSLIGESVQVAITLNDAQMRNLTYATAEITLNAMQLDVHPGPLLS